MGGSNTQAWGKGNVSGYSNKDKGSATHSKGSKGTKDDSMWGGNSWSGSNAWNDGEFW